MMQRNPVFESLKDSSRLRTLVWHLSMQKASYTCPFEGCGELIRQNRQDTPPRSFRELAEVMPRSVVTSSA